MRNADCGALSFRTKRYLWRIGGGRLPHAIIKRTPISAIITEVVKETLVRRVYGGDTCQKAHQAGPLLWIQKEVSCRLSASVRMATTKEYGDQADDQSASTFALTEEDHTLGNSLRYILNKDPRVSFVGYTIPHPAEERVHLRIQTTGPSARSVLKESLQDLISVCEHVRVTFDKAVDDEKALQGVREMSVGVSGRSGFSGKSGITHQSALSKVPEPS
ncbi:hypothetical protein R1flu_028980 [Riccia fluitans]|uniref:DNA-directed RNA polymerases I and III subunit RPAC2 n=1 Tax=Riccia fluitans TaxID=41844 RepID=A0ABD1XNB8_9MARC